jgi:hypothetical protein
MWEVNTDKIRLGEKKQLLVNAIEKFCEQPCFKDQERLLSDKVQKLINILHDSYEQREGVNGTNNLKTIIFVKDRSVAVYLKKILSGEIRDIDPKSKFKAYLDKNKFRVDFAMGPKSKNLVNKAYKSTKMNSGKGLEFKALT